MYTAQQVIDEMVFAREVLCLAIAVVILVYFATGIRLLWTEHRLWKQIKELEKKVLESSLEDKNPGDN